MSAPILFAAGIGDWLEALLPVLLGLLWVVSQVFNALKAAGRARQQPPAVRPARPRPAVDPARADDIRAELERQIGEFLELPKPPTDRPASRRPRPTRGPPVVRKVVGQAGQAAPPTVSGAGRIAVPGRGPSAAQRSDVARHVEDAFSHELKHLGLSFPGAPPAGSEPQRPGAATPAAEFASALRNPATLRQLVLLREILERPVDRW